MSLHFNGSASEYAVDWTAMFQRPIQTAIAPRLKAHYQPSKELPPELIVLLRRIDAPHDQSQ